MPEHVKVNNELEIIEIQSEGDISEADLYTALNKVMSLYKSTGISLLLCDTRTQQSLPAIGAYKRFIEQIPRSITIAVLLSATGRTSNLQHFGEVVASQTTTFYKTFYEQSKALQWLRDMSGLRKSALPKSE